jgi:GTP-binding protein EngB required for normal cell division
MRLPFLNLFNREAMQAELTNTTYYPFNDLNWVPTKQYAMSNKFTADAPENFIAASSVGAFCKDIAEAKLSDYREIAVVGRSNVGKSSLINSLLGKQLAQTSKTPGRTQQIITYPLQLSSINASLMDCPGYGYAKAPKKEMDSWARLMSIYLKNSHK